MTYRFIIGLSLGFAVFAGIRVGWTHYEERIAQVTAQKELKQIPPARVYPDAITLRGQRDGFQSVLIASVEGTYPSVVSVVSGSWVLTYTGNNPPEVTSLAVYGFVDNINYVIVLRSFSLPLHAVKIGPHRYLYWCTTQWSNPWPFSPEQTRAEFRTSVVRIGLASGRDILITH